MTDLSGKRALVTGGGTGLGAELALTLAQAGAEVWIAGRRMEPLEAVAARHDSIHPVSADVTDEAQVDAMFETSGPCHIVIANAGASESVPFAKTSLDSWNRMLSVNLTGAFLTLRNGARQMQGRDWGRLIAVAGEGRFIVLFGRSEHNLISI